MANAPAGVVLKRDRDLEGRKWQIWLRRGLFSLLGVISILALVNVFGQHPQTSRAQSAAATLELYAPKRVRSGLLYQARFRIEAHSELKKAALVLAPGWLESLTVNTIEPTPESETSDHGKLRLELGKIDAGDTFQLHMQFQVNPTNVGHRSQRVELMDGNARLLTIRRTITIFP
jgi:hypothetical protein